MDKTIIIIGIIAIVAVLAVTLVLNPFGTPEKQQKNVENPKVVVDNMPEEEERPKIEHPDIDIDPAEIEEIIKPKIEGNCELYKHVAKNQFQCFGTAGNFSTMATNEYRPSEPDEYFCKPTKYGCKLYQSVEFRLG